jgi:hypothetical protein
MHPAVAGLIGCAFGMIAMRLFDKFQVRKRDNDLREIVRVSDAWMRKRGLK